MNTMRERTPQSGNVRGSIANRGGSCANRIGIDIKPRDHVGITRTAGREPTAAKNPAAGSEQSARPTRRINDPEPTACPIELRAQRESRDKCRRRRSAVVDTVTPANLGLHAPPT